MQHRARASILRSEGSGEEEDFNPWQVYSFSRKSPLRVESTNLHMAPSKFHLLKWLGGSLPALPDCADEKFSSDEDEDLQTWNSERKRPRVNEDDYHPRIPKIFIRDARFSCAKVFPKKKQMVDWEGWEGRHIKQSSLRLLKRRQRQENTGCKKGKGFLVEARKSILNGEYSMSGVASYLRDLPHKPKVVVLMGAGVSTSAGIKDFRSADGLYADASTKNMFCSEFLSEFPELFYTKIAELFLPVVDKKILPTKAHALLRVLKDVGWLARVYTQNIDMLEFTLLENEDVVECHGSCRQARCFNNNCAFRVDTEADMKTLFWDILRSEGLHTNKDYPRCPECDDLLRPDVTFFGEQLPSNFEHMQDLDLPDCDFLLVMGTSLLVYPVAGMPSRVSPMCLRMLMNREVRGVFKDTPPCNKPAQESGSTKETGRDVFFEGTCDDAAESLIAALGMGVLMESVLQQFCGGK